MFLMRCFLILKFLSRKLSRRKDLGNYRVRTVRSSSSKTSYVLLREENPDYVGVLSKCSSSIKSERTREVLSFCSNDYLGFSCHPEIVSAFCSGAAAYGVGSGASHLLSGHVDPHHELECILAQWMRPYIPESEVLFFGTGYLANLALISTLATRESTVFSDKLNHASLLDGVRLSQAISLRYPHLQIDTLEKQLHACTSDIKLIVTDSVFSMDGDLAPLPQLLDLAERYDAWLMIDDAHGFGVLGPEGKGSLSYYNLRSERLIYMGTLGKAAGVAGAFVAAHPVIIEGLVNFARSYIYSTASPPAIASALKVSLRLLSGSYGAKCRGQLEMLRKHFRKGFSLSGIVQWRLLESETPIQSLLVGENADSVSLSHFLRDRDIWVPAIRPPTVPQGTARLRITLNASHTKNDVSRLIDLLCEADRCTN